MRKWGSYSNIFKDWNDNGKNWMCYFIGKEYYEAIYNLGYRVRIDYNAVMKNYLYSMPKYNESMGLTDQFALTEDGYFIICSAMFRDDLYCNYYLDRVLEQSGIDILQLKKDDKYELTEMKCEV